MNTPSKKGCAYKIWTRWNFKGTPFLTTPVFIEKGVPIKFFLLENIGFERCIWMFHLYRNKTIYLSHIVMNSLMTLKVNTIPRTGAGLVLLSCIYTWEISNHHQIYGLQLNIYINSIGPYFVYLQSVTQPVITKTGAPTYK